MKLKKVIANKLRDTELFANMNPYVCVKYNNKKNN